LLKDDLFDQVWIIFMKGMHRNLIYSESKLTRYNSMILEAELNFTTFN